MPRCLHRSSSPTYAWSCFRFATLYLYPILGTMERDDVGNLSPRDQMETSAHPHRPIDREYTVDDSFHRYMESLMDELKWKLQVERLILSKHK